MQPKWEIWLDTNLSPAIAKWMSGYSGYPVKSSYTLSLHFETDNFIYQKARKQGNVIIISKDSDFSDIINRLGAPPKLINIKIGNCSNRKLWSALKPHINEMINLLISHEFDIIDFED